jgi:hypothetical protein
MKRIFLIMLVIIFGLAVNSYAGIFFDDFNDGNADGWWLDPRGNWSFVNGTLLQTAHGDDYIGLVNNLVISDQVIETKVNPSGYGGVTFWYQDNRDVNNPNKITFANVVLYVWDRYGTNPYSGLRVTEVVDGVVYYSVYDHLTKPVWYDLAVDVNSSSGKIEIYVDGNHELTYDSFIANENRIGQSGIYSGNDGAYFDDFRVTSNDISPATIPITIDIRPWSKRNPVNYKGHGILPVAILSNDDFDAPSQVDQNSLTFGATGDEKSLAFCNRKPRNVRRDGSKDDLVCYFYVEVAGFKCGETKGILKGMTTSGIPIEGEDLVRIINCK